MIDFVLWFVLWSILGVAVYHFTKFCKNIFFNIRRKFKYGYIVKCLNSLFQDVNPFTLSFEARKLLHSSLSESTGLTYGEVSVNALLDLLQEINFKPQDIFYDLGSGIGKALIATKLCYPTLDVRGIEIIPTLHHIALQKYHQYLQNTGSTAKDFIITYILGDFFNYSFYDANIIFINGTGYNDDQFDRLLQKLLSLKIGTKIIVTSKMLPENKFKKISQSLEQMSWGWASTYIYQKERM